MQKYNVDKDAFSALLESLDYTHKSTNAVGEEVWNAPGDKPGDPSLTIRKSGAKYKVHVFTGKAAPLEQKGEYSFSDARKLLQNIDDAELTRRLVNEGYSDDKPKGKQTSSFAVRQAQTSAKPKPKYQFPSSLKLDEDSLLLPDGGELKQDPLILDAYRGRLTGNMRENIAFIYRDSDGKPASLVYRIKNKDGGKSIRQYAFNAGSGTFTAGGVDNKNRRLFLEESARELSTIIFCEGEKCAYDLQRFFLKQGINDVGATTAGGSNNINPDIIGAALGGKTVFILPDNDPPGYECAEEVRRALLGTGSPPVQVWKWSDGTPAGYDIANLLEEQGDKLTAGSSDLDSLFRSLEGLGAGSWTDGAFLFDYEKGEAGAGDSEDLPIIQTLAELTSSNIERPPFIVPGLIYQGDSVIVGAQRGVGKTWLSIELALSVATCKPFLARFNGGDKPYNVLIVNAEMPKWSLKERFDILTHDIQEHINNIMFLHWDDVLEQYNENINLAYPVWQKRLEKLIEEHRVDVLIIDPLGLVYSPDGVSPNAAEYATQFNRLLLMTRAHSCTLITTLHMGIEQGRIRGTSALVDMATLEISLTTTDDNKGSCYANFDFTITKNRNGINCPSFTASLYNGAWNCQDSDDIREAAREEQDKKEKYALELFRAGKTPGEIKTTEAGLVPEKGLQKLYEGYMLGYLSEQYDNGEPLKDLLDRYEKPLVREAVLKMYPNNYGAACVILFDAGDDRKSILQAYRKIKPGATEPPELIEAEAKRTAQKNEERKAEYFKQLDEGLRIDELRKKFEMPVKQHNAYFAEWSDGKARELIQAGVDIRDILQARLSDNRNKYDVEAVATSYMDIGNDKQAALEELSAIEGIDRGTLQRVAKGFGLSLPSRVGRPPKVKTESGETATAENIQKV